MDEIYNAVRDLLGIGQEAKDLDVVEMGLRALIIYVVTVAVVRLAKKRFMGRATAFDVILGIMLGSTVSRGVTGNAPFMSAIVAIIVMVGMHWLFSWIAIRWHGFGHAVKGRSEVLIRDGKIDWHAMREAHMTEHDLWEDLRSSGISDLAEVGEARLERNGKLSVVKRKQDPKVLLVDVKDGVQTVRIEFG